MKFSIVSNESDISNKCTSRLMHALITNGFGVDDVEPDIVFSIGGDGTFLKAIQKYKEIDAIYIGINTGNLGFLCEFKFEDVDTIIQKLKKGNYKVEERPLLKVDTKGKEFFAYNEVRIQSINGTSIKFDVHVNGRFLESIKGDGVLVSTPAGSTGVNKGHGGAIIDPSLNGIIQLTEMTLIRNSFYSSIGSSILLPENSLIRLDNFSSNEFDIYYDNKSYKVIDFDKKSVKITCFKNVVKVLKNDDKTYIERLNEGFVGYKN